MQREKHRLFLIDIMRVVCAFLIYARHSITMFGCTYGHTLDAVFTKLTSPVMTCFFILSGFSIHYQHQTEELTADWTRSFLIKRLISILPSYLLVVLLWPAAHPEQLKDWFLLLPADLLGIQTAYRTLFGILHNGGTWFVSCILFCYLLYPVIKSVLSSAGKYVHFALILTLSFILLYSNMIIPVYGLDSLYSNPIARTAEFAIGAAFSGMLYSQGTAVVFTAVLSAGIAFLNHAGITEFVCTYLVIPVILALLFAACRLRARWLENSRVLAILSGISYQFFLMQLFLWDISARVLAFLHTGRNAAKIVVSLSLCIVFSFLVWKFIDQPVRKKLKKKLLYKEKMS